VKAEESIETPLQITPDENGQLLKQELVYTKEDLEKLKVLKKEELTQIELMIQQKILLLEQREKELAEREQKVTEKEAALVAREMQ